MITAPLISLGDWGDQLPRSGGARAPLPHTQKIPLEENKTKHQKMTRDDDLHGEQDRQESNGDGGTNGGQPPMD